MVNAPLSGEILQTLFNHASIGIIVANARGEIVLVNQFALGQFGYDHTEEIKGKTIEILIPRRMHDRHVGHRSNYIKDPKSRPMGIGMDLYASKKDGSEFPVEISLGNYEINGEKFVMAFINDITLRKKI
jgi:PAS domain S-box